MESYKHFKLAAYVFAYYLIEADERQIQQAIDYYRRYVHLDKVYLENHRGLVDIPAEKLRAVKALFEQNGIAVSGGITATGVINGQPKPSYYDTFCYTDPAHREKFLELVRGQAEIFDEIILDDFFFTSCTCEMCIEARGKQSWAEYRLKLMEDFAHEAVAEARRVNPKVNFIIKYPNWYESYQECGYNPGKQKDIFDMVYTGTETRDPRTTAQHLQRYMSYSIMRTLENTAPGRNGGGWIDSYSSTSMNFYLEQADMTLLGKAKELMLFNFSLLENTALLPALGHELARMDGILGKLGNPVGVSAWEPFDGDGEDQLYNYLGMGGIAVEPTPYFDENADMVLLTESSAHDETAFEKLERYLRRGGTAMVTVGFFRACYDRGMKDLTSVRLTHRHVLGGEYMVAHYNYNDDVSFCRGRERLLFEILNYKTNATSSNISILADENNFPLMTEDRYGKGRLFILNVPENFADLYKLPKDVWRGIAKYASYGQRVYMAGEGRHSLICYDNGHYALQSYNPTADTVDVIVRSDCKGLRDMETGLEYTQRIALPPPSHMMDAVTLIPEPQEYAFPVQIGAGQLMFLEIIE